MRFLLAAAAAAVATVFVLVFWLSSASVMVEWQIALLVLSGLLAAALTAALYRGVRLSRPGPPPARKSRSGASDIDLSGLSFVDPSGCSDDAAGALALIVVVAIALVLVLVTLQIALLIGPPLWFAAYFAVNRGLRGVLASSRQCAGNLRRSLAYGLGYTALGMGAVFAATWLVWLAIRLF